MKKLILFVAMLAVFCVSSSFTNTRVVHTALKQTKAPAFCKLTFIDHNGHSTKLSTSNLHATEKMMQANFDTGERLTITFSSFRIVAGHFVADSPRSKDPQIQLITPRHIYRLTGAVTITNSKIIAGNFSHLVSDDDDSITLIAGSFSM